MPSISSVGPRPFTTYPSSSSPLLRQGARGSDVTRLQQQLQSAGFSPGAVDGSFGWATKSAVIAFQRARGLEADGVVGAKTWAALSGSAPAPSPAPSGELGRYRYSARGTGYYPANNRMEGGFEDRMGHRLYTLQEYLAGRAPYVSVAMDSKTFAYGTKLRIPELEAKYGRKIEFRVVDTGGAFVGRGTSRIDICTANSAASVDAAINGRLTLCFDTASRA